VLINDRVHFKDVTLILYEKDKRVMDAWDNILEWNYDGAEGSHDLGVYDVEKGNVDALPCYPVNLYNGRRWPPPICWFNSVINLKDICGSREESMIAFVPCLYSLFVRAVCAGAIYRTEVCTEVCAGAIYPNKVVSEPGYDKQWQKTALGAVRLSLAKNVAYNVVNEKTTYGLFNALSNMYEKPSASNKVFLIRKLVNTKMNQGGRFEDTQVRRSTRESRAPVRYSPSANYLLLTENEPDVFLSQITSRKEDITKIVDVQGALNDTSTQHKSDGFQLAGQEENLECRLKEILVLIFVEDSWNEEPCSDVHQVGDEREVKVRRSFNWPPSELITEDGVLPEKCYSQFNDVSSGYLCNYSKVPSPFAFWWMQVVFP
ncbi:hypothetical protein Tco_0776790, partial [Tanacetum coccineum]